MSPNDSGKEPASPKSSPVRAKRAVRDDKVMEIISKPLIEGRRDTMSQLERGFCECEITSAKVLHDSWTPTTKTPFLEVAAKHESIVPEIRVPDDDLDGPYNFQVVPPTPNKPETSMSEKQDAPKEERSFPHVEDDEIVRYHGARHLNKSKGHPLPYSSLKYGRD